MTSSAVVFVLTPFDKESLEVLDNLIAPPFKELGYEVQKAGSGLDQQNILKDIVEGIAVADLVIADLTGLNANVMYELGIAHGLNKPVLMLTQNISELPFDLRSYRVIRYSLNYRDADELKVQLRDIGAVHLKGGMHFGNPVSDFVPSHVVSNALVGRGVALNTNVENSVQKGLLDYAVAFEGAVEEVKLHANEITGIFGRSQSEMDKIINKMASINRSLTPVPAFRKYEVTKELALLLNDMSKEIDKETKALTVAVGGLNNATDDIVSISEIKSDVDKDEAQKAISQIGATVQIAVDGAAAMQKTREAMAELKDMNISQALNRSIVRTDSAISNLAQVFGLVKAYAERTTNVLQEKLQGA